MSITAIEWAFAQDVPVPSAKLVLLALADHINKHGKAWPSLTRLSERTNLHRATVIRALEVLTGLGLIEVDSRQGVVNRYRLSIELVAGCDRSETPDPSQNATTPVAECDGTRRKLRPVTIKNHKRTSSPSERAHRLPEGWEPDAALVEWVTSTFPDLDWSLHNDIFQDYWRSSSGRTASKLDWAAAWRNWMRREASRPSAYRSAAAARMDGRLRTNAERLDRALARRTSGEAVDGPGGPRLRLIAGGHRHADD